MINTMLIAQLPLGYVKHGKPLRSHIAFQPEHVLIARVSQLLQRLLYTVNDLLGSLRRCHVAIPDIFHPRRTSPDETKVADS